MLCFLLVQMHDQLIVCLEEHIHERKNRYRDGLAEYIKSSTDAVFECVEEQKQELNKAVVKLTDRIQVLSQWLSEAGHLE